MFESVQKYWSRMDGGIFSAAVADYRPKEQAPEKIKKKEDELSLQLIKNPDSLKWAGEHKQKHQILAGFALETINAFEHGKEKLTKKNLDFIVINSPVKGVTGFGSDTNQISILDNHNKLTNFELKTKQEVAKDIINYYINYRQ